MASRRSIVGKKTNRKTKRSTHNLDAPDEMAINIFDTRVSVGWSCRRSEKEPLINFPLLPGRSSLSLQWRTWEINQKMSRKLKSRVLCPDKNNCVVSSSMAARVFCLHIVIFTIQLNQGDRIREISVWRSWNSRGNRATYLKTACAASIELMTSFTCRHFAEKTEFF